MKYSITCPHCGSEYLMDFPHGGEVRCRCQNCGATIRVRLPKRRKPTRDELDRRLRRFFIMSALFVVTAIGCLFIVAFILKNV